MPFGSLENDIRDALREEFATIPGEFQLAVADAHLSDGKRWYTYSDFEPGTELYEQVIQKIVAWAAAAKCLDSLLEASIGRRQNSLRLQALAYRLYQAMQADRPLPVTWVRLAKLRRIVGDVPLSDDLLKEIWPQTLLGRAFPRRSNEEVDLLGNRDAGPIRGRSVRPAFRVPSPVGRTGGAGQRVRRREGMGGGDTAGRGTTEGCPRGVP